MTKIRVEVVGVAELVRQFQGRLVGRVRSGVAQEIQRLGEALARRVKEGYLRGPRPQRLGRRTGTLSGSIHTRMEDTPGRITAAVGTNVRYGVMWELTGHRAYTVWPVKKKALFWKGASHPVARVRIPAAEPRPFLKPAWLDMQPTIVKGLNDAVRRAVGGP